MAVGENMIGLAQYGRSPTSTFSLVSAEKTPEAPDGLQAQAVPVLPSLCEILAMRPSASGLRARLFRPLHIDA